jgi:hypothetical protein
MATCRPTVKMATKLNSADIATAVWGFSTPVDTTVAIALAASWKPFMKSKTSAKRTSRPST